MRKIKLFCIPYAGGSANVFLDWKDRLSSYELFPIELAGKGRRFLEPSYSNLNQAINDIFLSIDDEIADTPYALFGHSMGALYAFELLYKLRDEKRPMPVCTFFSGKNPPHIKAKKIRHVLNDDEFLKELRKMGGTPQELLESKELMNLFIPILREDFRITETYLLPNKREKIDCPFVILNGKNDELTDSNIMKEWGEYTGKGIQTFDFEGEHFFIQTHVKEVLEVIDNFLFEYMN
ncbi:thioesterase II family protein [Bacillus pacificus]|uniref:thioesterase II family protein n=1 Tax=Bacillus pacificus TaxID=2026187 RepID=UPI003D651255